MRTSITRLLTVICAVAVTIPVFAQENRPQEKVTDFTKKADTRVDNNGYWKMKAALGQARLNGMQNVPSATYTGSEIRALSVITEDSPDVPVAPSNTTQSEVSVFTNPEDNLKVLNSNNSSANPMTTFYGADALRSEDGGLVWGGTVQGPAGSNSGDPVALIGNNGWYYVNYINNSYGQSVDISQNGGTTWTRKLVANAENGGILDKNHMWIDNSPVSPYDGNMYCAWTDFYGSIDSEIGFSRSTDGGMTWSARVPVSTAVNAGSHNQGVNINAGPNGEVYVIWTIYDSWPSDETAIGMARSMNGGSSFETAERIITNIRGIRTTGVNKNMRVNSFPVCAVDISGGEHNGNVYIVWTNIGVPGINSGNDADVYFVRSEDQGETWTDPVKINQDAPGLGRKHYFPWITCDPETGILSVIYYDDRNTGGAQCEVYCANSYDAGETWEDFKVSDVAFTPTPIAGLADGYMGDYIGINARGGMVYPCWADTRTGSVMTYCSPYETNALARPKDLTGVITFETGALDLIWKFDEEPGFSYFKIYRDGDSVATATDTVFSDMLPDYGIYNYGVTAVFQGLGESSAASGSFQWGDAHIAVDPDHLTETLLPETTLTRTVTVTNVGQLEMNYDITQFIQTGKKAGNRDYCDATNGCDEFIARVQLENIDNSTACSGYADYTDQSVTVMPGHEYTITVTNGSVEWFADQCGIWIDWNQDEVFGDDESLAVIGSPGVGPYSATITPPVNAVAGATRMRVRIVYGETPVPCGNSDYGETEDYTINVINWLDYEPKQGSVMPGESVDIDVIFSSIGMAIGQYAAELRITSNDPDNSLIVVPVVMNVSDVLVTVSADQDSVCQGAMVQLSSQVQGGSGNPVYSWTSEPPGFTSSEPNPVVYPDASTKYILEITEGEVTVSDNVDVVVFPLPQVSLGEDLAMCEGESRTLDAGAGFAAYLWSTGETTQTIITGTTGDYWVEVATEHGCTDRDTLAMVVNSLPVVALGADTTLCYYHQIMLDAGNPGATYLWSTGETSPTITVDSTGMAAGSKTLSVSVTSADGCQSYDSIVISFIECTGIGETEAPRPLQVYPNPGDGRFSVFAAVLQPTRADLTVISTGGATVYDKANVILQPSTKLEINLQHLTEGTYTLQLVTADAVYQARIIIQKTK